MAFGLGRHCAANFDTNRLSVPDFTISSLLQKVAKFERASAHQWDCIGRGELLELCAGWTDSNPRVTLEGEITWIVNLRREERGRRQKETICD